MSNLMEQIEEQTRVNALIDNILDNANLCSPAKRRAFLVRFNEIVTQQGKPPVFTDEEVDYYSVNGFPD